MGEIPKKYKHQDIEARWGEVWEEWGIYRYDPTLPKEATFSVDSPPPTVSGSLHVGHVFSYTHQDLVTRYQRMTGKNISYPMGWDDNGLPTERRVQNLLAVKCDPSLPYDAEWKANPNKSRKEKKRAEEISRRNFIEACSLVTEEDEAAFETLWRRLGLSIDWSTQYATIDERSRTVSQASFLELVEKNQVYSTLAPTMWDVDFQTAVAQAEVEDRPKNGAYHDIRFAIEGGGEFQISTTRPELLPACIAVVAHPDDERYQHLFGKRAITPIFKAPVPIRASTHADPEKGTGILMVCTFGDSADVDWWKQSKLPVKQVINTKGVMMPVTFGEGVFESLDSEAAQAAYDTLQGLSAFKAKKAMVELLQAEGSAVDGEGTALVGEPRPTEQMVKFYEKGDRPLEFVTTRQWFVKILEHKDALLAQGAKIQWHPSHFRTRYDHWVEGLNQDWCISRQRYFGVPFPVWYHLDEHGEPDYGNPIFAKVEDLPADPLSDAAPGFTEAQRGQPGGFMGDPDVMDTWATSSMTPQIVSGWPQDMERHNTLMPMDVRPQSHEIIRTWAFYTIVKAWMHHDEIPWKNVMISGWILDPDRKKMSKSKGNTVVPDKLLAEFSSDAVRYWTARARLGTDTAFDQSVFKVGKRLITKLFNASKFVMMQLERASDAGVPKVSDITVGTDRALVDRIRGVITQATNAFERFDYAQALQVSEESFWGFCDHYLELVKERSYRDEDSPERRSALATLSWALNTYLRLLAPVLPYITEEVFSWRFATDSGRGRSVHTSPWPSVDEVADVAPMAVNKAYGAAVDVLKEIRAAKTTAQKSQKWPVESLEVTCHADDRAALEAVLPDVLRAGGVPESGVTLNDGTPEEGARFAVTVTLGAEASQS